MADHTPIQRLRAPKALWDAYAAVCRRALDRSRSEDLLAHMRRTIQRHGTDEEKAQLAASMHEIAERLERKHQGRPPASS